MLAAKHDTLSASQPAPTATLSRMTTSPNTSPRATLHINFTARDHADEDSINFIRRALRERVVTLLTTAEAP